MPRGQGAGAKMPIKKEGEAATAMHRRGHKKSRNGCLECKRRHMKCDESRPQCLNCTTVSRVCQYMNDLQGRSTPSSGSARTQPTISPGGSHPASVSPGTPAVYEPSPRNNTANTSTASPHGDWPAARVKDETYESQTSGGSPGSAMSSSRRPTSTTTPQMSLPSTPRHGQMDDSDGPVVQMAYAELAMHFSCSVSSPEMTDPQLVATSNKLVTEEAGRVPYLMMQCMAISARHLSVLRPERRDYYLEHSVRLQAKAIALFRETNAMSMDASNIVAALLFSSILNRLALTDVLANRAGTFEEFLDRFASSTLLQRGIRTVWNEAHAGLVESRMPELVEWATPGRDTVLVGHHCDELHRLVTVSPTLSPVDREACRTAVHFLQLAFDGYVNPKPGKTEHQIVFIWGMYLPDEFFALLRANRVEAVATMAWYAVLLHECRGIWQVGDAGVFVLQSVSDYLGPAWSHWLEWPWSAVRNGLPR